MASEPTTSPQKAYLIKTNAIQGAADVDGPGVEAGHARAAQAPHRVQAPHRHGGRQRGRHHYRDDVQRLYHYVAGGHFSVRLSDR